MKTLKRFTALAAVIAPATLAFSDQAIAERSSQAGGSSQAVQQYQLPDLTSIAADFPQRTGLEHTTGDELRFMAAHERDVISTTARTTVAGFVQFEDGKPAENAVVVTQLGRQAVTGADGSFAIDLAEPAGQSAVGVTAVASINGVNYVGSRQVRPAAPGRIGDSPIVLHSTGGDAPTCESLEWLPTFGAAPGMSDMVRVLTVYDDGLGSGPALYAGGDFTSVGDVTANYIARWDGESWSPLSTGMNSYVSALTVFDDGLGAGPALYAGGDFTTAGGVNARHIARWNGESWSPLRSGGMSGWVSALTVFDDGSGPALYAGGSFTSAGGVEANRIARWDGEFWSPLGTGMDWWVTALTVFDDGSGAGPALYAGGIFTTAGGVTASRIARWNGDSWSPLRTGGMSGWGIFALTVFDDGSGAGPALYAGGLFTSAGGVTVNNIARWDGESWSSLGSGTNGWVREVTVFDDGSGAGPALHAAGQFTTAGGVTTLRIARWNGDSWSPLRTGGMNGTVNALTVFDDGSGAGPALYAGGDFTLAGGVTVNSIARLGGNTWSPLSTTGLNGSVSALTIFDDGSGAGPALYAGGNFTWADGVAVNHIARWNGESWSSLSTGMSGYVSALTVFDDGSGAGPALFVGGNFTAAGGVTVNNIARWDGESWSPLSTGMSDRVSALTVFDDGSGAGPALYAGGLFTSAGGVTVNNIARWDGESWSPLGRGTNNWVLALTVFDDGSGAGPALYAGGMFGSAGGVTVNSIARWNGESWSPLGSGVTGSPVRALTVFDDGSGAGPALYAGGSFISAGGLAASRIARWDGESWSPLSTGVSVSVYALTVFDDGSGAGPALYAGGPFTTAGGMNARRIARWDGESWSPLGAGVSSTVIALTVFDDGSGDGPALYAGGTFTSSPGGDSFIARWSCAVPACALADLNCDGAVDVSDLLVLLAAWGPCPTSGNCAADLNGDGAVDVYDLMILLSNWG